MAALAAASTTGLFGQGKPIFTENFESGKMYPAVRDQRVAGTATIAVEPADGAHGKYALHVHYPDMAVASYEFVVATQLPDSVRTHFFGRAYMKITPTLGTTHDPLIFAGEPGSCRSSTKLAHRAGKSCLRIRRTSRRGDRAAGR